MLDSLSLPLIQTLIQVFLDASDLGVLVLDERERVILWNEWLAVRTGIPSDTAQGRPLAELLPELPPTVWQALRSVLTEGQPRVLSPALHQLGRPFDPPIRPEVRMFPLPDAGRIRGALILLHDLAALLAYEEAAAAALRESEERFRRLAESARDLIYRYEFVPKPRFTYVNPAATGMTGYTPEEHYADPQLGLKLVHPDDRPLLEAYFQGEGAFHTPLTLRWVHKDGHVFWTEQINVPVYDPDGNLIALEGVARDITARKEAEETLSRWSARLEVLREVSLELATRERTDPEQVYTAIHQAVARLMPCEAFVIALLDESRGESVGVYLIDRGGRWPGLRLPLEQGLTGRVMITGQSLKIDDLAAQDAARGVHFGAAESVRSLLVAPMRLGERIIGALSTQSYRPDAFTDEDLKLLEMLAAHAAIALENARLYEEARRRNRELALLNRVIAASATTSRVETILETACRELALAFQLPQSGAALLNAARTEAVVVAEYHTEGRPSALGAIIPVEGNPSFQFLLTEKRPLVIDDATSDPRLSPVHDLMRRRDVASILLLPLLVEGEVVGSLGLDALEARRFTSEEVELAWRVAEQVGGALARAWLEEERVRLSTAVEQAAESVLITDRQGVITYANPALERISGYSRAELVGQTPRLFKSGRHDAAFYRRLWETIQSGQAWQGRFINRRKDGQLYYEDTTIAPLRDAAGEIVGYVSTGRDVTQEVSLEEQFRQAQKMEAVGRLAGGVAHDFNNLLTIIQLSARLMGKQLHAEDPLQVQLERIQEACHRANELTKQLLTFSRQTPLETRRVDLNDSIREMSRMLPRLLGEDIELVLALSEDLWPVVGDANQLDQVLLNLAVNARDAMPQGGRLLIETANVVLDRVYTEHHFGVEPGEYVMLAVSDTGEGMSEEVKARIFEPFFTTKGPGQGTGLGLSTVYGIVKRHGGHIGVYSEVGQGSTFKVYLPRDGREAEARPAILEPSAAVVRRPRQATLLVVEDAADIRQLITQALRESGYEVLVATQGVEALELSETHEGPIHLLLTDVVMPQMGGGELARRLQARRPEMRVLYMSGYTENVIATHGVLKAGVAFLPKPFTLEALIQKVEEALG